MPTPEGLILDSDGGYVEVEEVAGGVEIAAKCRETARGSARRFLATDDYASVVVLRRRFNATSAATVSGPAVVWSYADGHGMEILAVLRRGFEFVLWTPGHHGHGPGTSLAGEVMPTGEIRWAKLPSAKRIILDDPRLAEAKMEQAEAEARLQSEKSRFQAAKAEIERIEAGIAAAKKAAEKAELDAIRHSQLSDTFEALVASGVTDLEKLRKALGYEK